jgi:hypothetical protein
MKPRLTVLTNSAMTAWRRCPREYELLYVRGYRSTADAEALRFGTAWHAGLEQLFRGLGLEVAIDTACADAADAFEAAKLRVLLTGYEARWGFQGDALTIRGIEETFFAPLRNPDTGSESKSFQLGGKLDVRLADGFMEHKTTSDDIEMGSLYWRVLTLDSQVSTYYAGARALGTEPQRCIYDVVKKPALRPKQVPLTDEDGVMIVLDAQGNRVRTKDGKKWRESASAADGYVKQTRDETAEEYEARLLEDVMAHPDAYYARGEVVRLESELHEAEQDAWDVGQQILEARRRGRYPRNANACRRYGSVCAYFSVCCGEATLDDTTKFVRVENVHPELSDLNAEAAE